MRIPANDLRGGVMLTEQQQYIEDRIERIPECGCWIWMKSCIGWGYGQAKVDHCHVYAHHLAWEAYRGPRTPGLQVLHTCDTPPCCNPYHLYLGTAKQNTHDRLRRGKRLEGEAHGMVKLTETQVLEIRQTIPGIDSEVAVAARYNISPAMVGYIRRKQYWTHLKDL